MIADHRADDALADDLLEGLVACHSPSGKEDEAATYLVQRMRSLGFRSAVDEAGNAVGQLGDRGRTVLMLGHIDTVPGVIDVRQEGDLLYGRGTVDAKGPLAAFVVAAARAGSLPGKRLVVVGAVEEEAATSRGARYLLDHMPFGSGSPEAVIIGEPSGWDRITVGYKGRLLLKYVLSREAGHTAGPGASVCEEAVGYWLRVAEHADEHNAAHPRMFDQLMPSLRGIHSAGDGLAEQVTMTIGFRLPIDMDVDALQGLLTTWSGEARLSFYGREAAYRAPKSTSLARAFVRAIRAEGARAAFKVKSGTSDMNVVGPAWDCPILAYGPGDSSLDHTPREHIGLHEYHRAIAVLTRVLELL